jgi:hypothetical protein
MAKTAQLILFHCIILDVNWSLLATEHLQIGHYKLLMMKIF